MKVGCIDEPLTFNPITNTLVVAQTTNQPINQSTNQPMYDEWNKYLVTLKSNQSTHSRRERRRRSYVDDDDDIVEGLVVVVVEMKVATKSYSALCNDG